MSEPMPRIVKMREVSTIASLIAVPFFLLFLKSCTDKHAAELDARRQYVQMAIEILRGPSDASGDQQRLRTWAVKILDAYAPIAFDAETKSELERGGWQPKGWQPPGYQPNGFQPNGLGE